MELIKLTAIELWKDLKFMIEIRSLIDAVMVSVLAFMISQSYVYLIAVLIGFLIHFINVYIELKKSTIEKND